MKAFIYVFLAVQAALLPSAFSIRLRGEDSLQLLSDNFLQATSSCTDFSKSLQVQASLSASADNWAACRRDIEPPREVAEEVHSKINAVLSAAKTVERITEQTANAAKKVETVAKSKLKALTSIPKVGKVVKLLIEVVDEAEDILQQTNQRVEDARKLIEKLEKGAEAVTVTMERIATATDVATTGFGAAAKFETTIIACSKKTESCTDDHLVEKTNSGFLVPAKAAETVSKICPAAFSTTRTILQKLRDLVKDNIFDKLKKIVDKVRRALQPVLDKLEDILDEIGKHFQRIYCCTTPLIAQIAFKGISQVLDLVTCPVDALSNGLEAVLQEMTKFVNDAVFTFIRKALEQLPDVTIKFPAVKLGKVDPETCEFTMPSIAMESQSLLEPIISAVQSDKPSLKPIGSAFGNLGKNIRDDCKEALREVGKNLKEDCCKHFHPLRDGLFCDPTNTVPFKHCTQCESGKFSFHVKKVHVACGIDDTLKKVVTKVGDGIKDVAKKVGDGTKKVVKKIGTGTKKVVNKVGSGLKTAGKKVKKFFG